MKFIKYSAFRNDLRSCCLLIFVSLVFFTSANASQITKGKTVNKCPPDFIHLSKKCYHFSTDEASWQDAYYNCKSKNSTLATISHPCQEPRLRNYINKRSLLLGKYERWIGARYNWKRSEWIWGESGKPLDFKAFAGENRTGGEWQWHCAILDPALDNRWSSRNCYEPRHYVCQTKVHKGAPNRNRRDREVILARCKQADLSPKEIRRCKRLLKIYNRNNTNNPENIMMPHKPQKPLDKIYVCQSHMILLGNKCYYFSREELPFIDAHYACESNNSKLAIIKSQNQDHMLRNFLNEHYVEKRERWIGGTYDWKRKTWIWHRTGEKLFYNGFPDNSLKSRKLTWNSIIMDPALFHGWNAKLMTESKNFICQTRAKTIPYMGVRSNDPKPKKPRKHNLDRYYYKHNYI